jgi:membrane protein DedA with SNARE-associated domain
MTHWWESGKQLVEAGLTGMAEPWIIFVILFLTTFLLEDVALAAGAILASNHTVSWEFSFLAVAVGIGLGDLGLYGLGKLCLRFPFLRNRYIEEKKIGLREAMLNRLGSAVILARVIPGLRFFTYTASGFLSIPFWSFSFWVIIAVSAWTLALFWLSSALGYSFAKSLGIPVPVAVGILIVILAFLVPFFQFLKKRIA